jgi:general secretion pathway protein J
MGIFAVMSVMAYGGLSSVLNARGRIAAAFERTAALQQGYLRLRNDFQQLRARPVRDGYGEVQPALVAQHDGTVEFTRSGWRNPLSQPRSALERVAYRVDDKQQLVRTTWRVLDRAQDSAPVDLVLFDQVEELQWRFLDASLQWQTDWPEASVLQAAGGTPVVPPPRAVELTLTLKDLGEVRFLFSATNAAPPRAAAPPPAGPRT